MLTGPKRRHILEWRFDSKGWWPHNEKVIGLGPGGRTPNGTVDHRIPSAVVIDCGLGESSREAPPEWPSRLVDTGWSRPLLRGSTDEEAGQFAAAHSGRKIF